MIVRLRRAVLVAALLVLGALGGPSSVYADEGGDFSTGSCGLQPGTSFEAWRYAEFDASVGGSLTVYFEDDWLPDGDSDADTDDAYLDVGLLSSPYSIFTEFGTGTAPGTEETLTWGAGEVGTVVVYGYWYPVPEYDPQYCAGGAAAPVGWWLWNELGGGGTGEISAFTGAALDIVNLVVFVVTVGTALGVFGIFFLMAAAGLRP